MKSKNNNTLIIIVCGVLAVACTLLFSAIRYRYLAVNSDVKLEESIVPQEITDQTFFGHKVAKLYDKGKLIGVFNDRSILKNALNNIYVSEYQTDYPNSSLALSPSVYFTEESSYFYYENKDEEIIEYLRKNKLFALEVNRVEFSNNVVVYVKNMEDFETAKDQYLLNYVDKESLDLIRVNQLPPELTTYGERIVGIQVAEQYTVTRAYAPIEDIRNTVQEILYFFSYGYGTNLETYTTEEFDTVEWVASKYGLTAQQLITLNADVLKSPTQLLTTGTKLNVTFFQSPINVIVTKERIAKEAVYAGNTIYRANPEVREGINNIVVEEKDGSKNVYYSEVYINGLLDQQEVTKEEITLEPVQEVVEYGTMIIPGVGTGSFRYPVANPHISCHWGCYNNAAWGFHSGVDIQNNGNRYGSVLAADRGTIEEVGYNSINGYYVYINHNNGYRTYYGHMASMCYFPVGTNVEKGEVIGQIGMTGAATGPHVHFVIYTGREKHDACIWLGC
ncbi:MAG: peptidoglycan DD-metalloendopeptidase family protein [Erysipelotrichaceae bacterium]|nr:peptidoglycan DD-metalloendopeptidase family protein [Erysipelotrichaceae bacterium]